LILWGKELKREEGRSLRMQGVLGGDRTRKGFSEQEKQQEHWRNTTYIGWKSLERAKGCIDRRGSEETTKKGKKHRRVSGVFGQQALGMKKARKKMFVFEAYVKKTPDPDIDVTIKWGCLEQQTAHCKTADRTGWGWEITPQVKRSHSNHFILKKKKASKRSGRRGGHVKNAGAVTGHNQREIAESPLGRAPKTRGVYQKGE